MRLVDELNLLVMRPADATETVECWQLALENRARPSVIALTRQNLPAVRLDYTEDNLCARGAYELRASSLGAPQVVLIATGSEIEIALQAQQALEGEGIATRVVSAPCLELFDEQSETYRTDILGKDTVRVAIEAAVGFGWDRYIGERGAFIGMKSFGASAPYKQLYQHFGITAQAVVAAAKERLSGK